jgi:hypothetical protein
VRKTILARDHLKPVHVEQIRTSLFSIVGREIGAELLRDNNRSAFNIRGVFIAFPNINLRGPAFRNRVPLFLQITARIFPCLMPFNIQRAARCGCAT